MWRKHTYLGLTVVAMSIAGMIFVTSASIKASAGDSPVANAAMKGDRAAVRELVKQAADVNAAQGDGMTALHWAATNGDAEMTATLLYAGANVHATTRIGGYTPLSMAAKNGSAAVTDLLLKAGANANAKAEDGLTPLMMASITGDGPTVRSLLEHGADPNAKETENGQTPLIFAAAFNRADAIEELVHHGADVNIATIVRQPPPTLTRSTTLPSNSQPIQQSSSGATAAAAAAAPAPARPPRPVVLGGGNTRGGGNLRGGLNALMYAARDGDQDAARALIQAGARLNDVSGDETTALLFAAINGHFDLASDLVQQGADVNIASVDGAAPLYGVIHTQWSRESFHPQPTIKRENTRYIDLMKELLDHGADPNMRLAKVLWYSSYGYAYESASEVGTTPFYKCAEVADIDGMKLLLSRGADPDIPNKDGVNALLIASGAGTHGNDDVMAPPGRLAAVRYLVEDLHFDVNASDNGGGGARGGAPVPQAPPAANPFAGPAAGGYTALHNAASRGDNEMILYLVSKGARPDAVTKTGISVVDMANGPRQRVQPYASTVALLEMLGAPNSHKCVSC